MAAQGPDGMLACTKREGFAVVGASPEFERMALDDFEELLADKPRNERWELIGGRVVRMMVGVRWEHARIVRDIEPGATSVENPTFLVEVLSPGTEARDRFEKWAVYQQLASLQHDVLVARDRPHLEVFDRVEGRWGGFRVIDGLDEVLDLPTIQALLPLRDIYCRALGTSAGHVS